MKKTLLLLLSCCSAFTVFAQTKTQYDTAVAKLKNYYNQLQTDSMYYMMSDRMKSLVTEEKAEGQFKSVYMQLGEIHSSIFTKEDKGIYFYKTVFSSNVLTLAISLDKNNKLETFRFLPYKADTAKRDKSNIVLKTATGDIYGTLVLPAGDKKVPVVLIIAGSGPTDRDGNNNSGLSTDAYKMIADSLQRAGIASVRYDKRSIGESADAGKKEAGIRFDDIVNDAAGFVKMLKEDKRFSSVIVLGHSEGSLIGMIVAEREKAAAYISVSGIAQRADKVLEKQIGKNTPGLGLAATIILDSLDKGYIVTNIDTDLLPLFHPSIQPYMISWLKYNPAQEIKKLKIPVLILQGTTDIQVDVEEAEQLKKACPHAAIKIIAGMNHVLKQAPAGRDQNIATYSDPALPLSPGLMGDIVSFINEDKK